MDSRSSALEAVAVDGLISIHATLADAGLKAGLPGCVVEIAMVAQALVRTAAAAVVPKAGLLPCAVKIVTDAQASVRAAAALGAPNAVSPDGIAVVKVALPG